MLRLATAGLVAALLVGGPDGGRDDVTGAEGSARLGSDRLALQLSYAPARGGYLNVSAAFTESGTNHAPVAITMQMLDGETVSFAVPGYPETRYHFRRMGDAVEARLERL